MDDVKMDSKLFHERVSQFCSAWKKDLASGPSGVFAGANSILITSGSGNALEKNIAMQIWLFGYEFPSTFMLLTLDTIYVATTAKKAKHLEQLQGGRFSLKVLIRGKDASENEGIFLTMIDEMHAAGKKLGLLFKDTSKGQIVDEWKRIYAAKAGDLQEVDIAAALSTTAFAVKDESELRAMRTASKACVALTNPFFLDEMSSILDQEKKVTHASLAGKIDKKLDDSKFWKTVELPNKSKLPADLDPTLLDWVFGPIIQSGGKYDLKMQAEIGKDVLHAGIIIAAMGLRYKSYCSTIARTYLVDPNKSQESNYKLLYHVHNLVIKEARDGVVVKDIYLKALAAVKSKKPEMEKHFLKNIGWGIGLEDKDTTLVLNAKNSRILRDGMTLCINTGFADVENPQARDKLSKVYSLLITDTIRVHGEEPVVFTVEAPTNADANSFFFKDDEEAAPTPKKEKKDHARAIASAVATKNITRTRLRSERKAQVDDDAEKRRKAHQKELREKNHRENLARFTEASDGKDGVKEKTFKRFESYKRDNQLPPKTRDLQVVVDQKSSTVVVPIMGRPVPFHINAIKTASKTDEGDWSSLRLIFMSPGQGVVRKDEQPFEDANAHFVRSLVYRSRTGDRYAEIVTLITNMKRDSAKKEQEKRDMEDVVEQDMLIEIRNRRPPVLDNVFLRPQMEGKRIAGKVEIHQNGIRYQSPLSPQQRVDVLFSNIRHMFFQPSERELIVIIHLHLKDPIIIGNKRKTKDVQFYREASDVQFDETGNRKRKYRYGDEDEFEAEQDERRRRAELDRLFHGFVEKISEAGKDAGLEVDMPIRELGFHGVPARSNVFIIPTTDCLVQLVEQPFMVVTIEDVETAHLERVQFGLKNFDLVFVFKDLSRAPVHINTVPVESLDRVKEWLDSSDILFSEGSLNIRWPTIMKTISSDPHGFFQNGGWSFLASEDEDEDGPEEEEESAFELDDDELEALSQSSEDGSEYGTGVSDEDDAEPSEEDEEDEDDEEEEEEEEEEERKRPAPQKKQHQQVVRRTREPTAADKERDRKKRRT